MRFLINSGVSDSGTHVLSPQSYALMTTPDDMNGKPAGPATPELAEAPLIFQHYGFGLGLHQENGDKMVGHTGGIAGYTACMETNVTRGFGVIAMSNLVEAPLHPCAIVLYAMQVLRAQSAGEPLPPVPGAKGLYLARTALGDAGKYAGAYTAPDGSQLVFNAAGTTLALQTAAGALPLYPRGDGNFYVNDPRFAIFGLTFVPNKAGVIDQIYSGDRWYYNAAYAGPKTFTAPAGAAAVTGRYESDQVWGSAYAARVIVVKGRLTLDGFTPLGPAKNGVYTIGTSTLRFDTPAAGQMQRMWIDGMPYYRVDLP